MQFLHANNEDSEQTAQMCRLILVTSGCTCQKVRFPTLRLNYQTLFSLKLNKENKAKQIKVTLAVFGLSALRDR